jgi:hypothetical protein
VRQLRGLSRILAFAICVSANLQAFAATARFQTGQSYSAGITPQGVVIADFNKDGKQDVVVVSSYGTAQNVYVLLGSGDGTLQPASVLSVNGSLYAVAAGDFNNDGNLDLAVVDNTHSALLILLGNGDGTFAQPTTANTCLTGPQPVALAVGDLNGDGKLDVVTANYGPDTTNGANSVTVCLGDGAGGFSAANTVTASTLSVSNPNGIAIADVTGDGKPDIVVSLWQNAYSILAGNGNGTFRAPSTQTIVPPATNPYAVAVADLNGDGKADLIFPNGNGISVFFGNGNGTFQPETVYPGTGDAVVVADMNGDGKPDIVTTDWVLGRVDVLTNLGGASFSAPLSYVSGTQPHALAVGDLNGDGHPDVVAANAGLGAGVEAGNITVLVGNGDSTLRGAPGFRCDRAGRLSSAGPVVSADFNGDGLPDAAVLNTGSSSVTIFIADAVLGFKPGVTYDTGNGTGANGDLDVAVGDVNGDGNLDIVTVGFAGVHVLLGNGDGTFRPVSSVINSASGQNIVVADIDGDGNADVAYTQEGGSANEIAVQYGDGTGGFSPPTVYLAAGIPTAIVATDVNHDGKVDLITANVGSGRAGSDTISVFFNQGNRQISGSTQQSIGPLGAAARLHLAIGDFDGNGSPDLAVVEDGNGQVSQSYLSVMLNNGAGAFTTFAQYSTGATLNAVTAGDFDGDGNADLAVAGGLVTYVLSGRGDGNFGTPAAYVAGGGEQGIVAGQFNNSGVPDIAVVADDNFSLSLLLNTAGTHATLTAGPNPSVYLQPVSISATFKPAVPWVGEPTGTFAIKDGASTLVSLPLDNAQSATFTTTGLAVATHPITGTYSGDGTFAPRVLKAAQVVNRATPSIQLSSSANPALVSAAVTLTATFTGPFGGTGSGTFSFAEGGTTLTSGIANSSGQGTLSKANWPAGPHAITVTYSGDANLAPATVTYSQDIQNPTTTTLTSPATAVFGASATLTAVVTAAAAPVPTGTVDFVADGSSILGSPSLDASGQAILSTNLIPDGVHTVTAKYRGDSYSTASTAQATSLSVADFGMTAQPNSATLRAGQSATMTIAISGIAGFSSQVSLACANVPALATCTFTPPTVTAATSPATSTLVIKTAGTAVALLTPPTVPLSQRTEIALALVSFGAFGIAWAGASVRKRYATVGILMIPLILALASCGGGGNSTLPPPPVPSTPTGTTNIIVTGTSSMNGTSVSHQLPVTITVTP